MPNPPVRLVLVLIVWSLAACRGEVVTGLDEAQAQAALAALGRAGVGATREAAGEGGNTPRYAVVVPASEVARAAAVLEAEGLPRRAVPGFAQLYAAASVIPSVTEERARFTSALSGEIAGQLEHLVGVLDASVLVNVPSADPLAPADAPVEPASASVLLTVRAGSPAPQVADVQHLVSGAVAGLADARVTVVVQSAAPPPAGAASFASVAGIVVARGSKSSLLVTLAGALILLMAVGAWAAIAGSRRRRLPS
jgi:type III secretion protein J